MRRAVQTAGPLAAVALAACGGSPRPHQPAPLDTEITVTDPVDRIEIETASGMIDVRPSVVAGKTHVSAVVSTAGERALIEGDPEASRGLVDALPGIEPWGFFAAVPIAAFRSRS